ncbi:MAG: Stp1/IreP family PP2C-type Ser/Thr phosphatase [Chloroflexota bacterium]
MSNIGQIEASLLTDIGQKRDTNQDFVAYWQPNTEEEEDKHGWLYIVADGVGGADAGDFASRFASEQTIESYLNNEAELHWGQRLVKSMQIANTNLRQYVAENTENSRMATTMVAAIIYKSHLFVTNVGDSRGYLWQNGQFSQITKDQSLVAKLVEEGAISEEEAKEHPHGNIILSSLGSEANPQIDLFDFKLQSGDILLLCSDGLTKYVEDDEIAQVIQSGSPSEASQKLIRMANERGGSDNISVGIVHYFPQKTAVFKTKPKPKKESQNHSGVKSRSLLWGYTAFLSLVQTALICLVWALLRV